MTTISVPLPSDLEASLNYLVKSGVGENKAEVVRKAIRRLAEEEAVNAVLQAQKEPSLKGDIRDLLKKIK